MTTLIQKADEIVEKIREITGVKEANIWKNVVGKERIYITLMRADSKGKDYGGGGGKVYLDLNSGNVIAPTNGYNGTPFYNSYTLRFHRDNDTLVKIEQTVTKPKRRG